MNVRRYSDDDIIRELREHLVKHYRKNRLPKATAECAADGVVERLTKIMRSGDGWELVRLMQKWGAST